MMEAPLRESGSVVGSSNGSLGPGVMTTSARRFLRAKPTASRLRRHGSRVQYAGRTADIQRSIVSPTGAK